jgi:TfoX/Sxy family transcriptional regulator of competence genes
MAYDLKLAERIRAFTQRFDDVTERRMFGGYGFVKNGRLAVGIMGEKLIVKIPKDEYDRLIKKRGVGPMTPMGRNVKGFVLVSPESIKTKPSLAEWVARGLMAAQEMGPKTGAERERANRGKHYPSSPREVASFLSVFPENIREVTDKLREIVRNQGFSLTEKINKGWRSLNYHHIRSGFLFGIFPSKKFVKIYFESGAKLHDPHNVFLGKNLKQTRYLEFKTLEDVKKHTEHLGDFIREAISHKY